MATYLKTPQIISNLKQRGIDIYNLTPEQYRKLSTISVLSPTVASQTQYHGDGQNYINLVDALQSGNAGKINFTDLEKMLDSRFGKLSNETLKPKLGEENNPITLPEVVVQPQAEVNWADINNNLLPQKTQPYDPQKWFYEGIEWVKNNPYRAGLEIASYIPGVDVVADGLMAIDDYNNGDKIGAGIGAASILLPAFLDKPLKLLKRSPGKYYDFTKGWFEQDQLNNRSGRRRWRTNDIKKRQQLRYKNAPVASTKQELLDMFDKYSEEELDQMFYNAYKQHDFQLAQDLRDYHYIKNNQSLVDDLQKPKVMYHGTNHTFTEFNPSIGNNSLGTQFLEDRSMKPIFLTDDPFVAEKYNFMDAEVFNASEEQSKLQKLFKIKPKVIHGAVQVSPIKLTRDKGGVHALYGFSNPNNRMTVDYGGRVWRYSPIDTQPIYTGRYFKRNAEDPNDIQTWSKTFSTIDDALEYTLPYQKEFPMHTTYWGNVGREGLLPDDTFDMMVLKDIKDNGININKVHLPKTSSGLAIHLKMRNNPDQLTYTNILDNSEQPITDYMFWRPNQLKSAQAFTFDDDNNLIPLSLRDNLDSQDIRYKVGGILNKRFKNE